MDIKMPVAMLKKFLKKFPHEELTESIEYKSDDRIQEVEIDNFSDNELDLLTEIAQALGDVTPGPTIVRRISTFRNIKLDPSGRHVKRLEDLEQALKLFLKKVENHWLFEEDESFAMPCLITDISYSPYDARSESPANVELELTYLQRGKRRRNSHYWHVEDIRGGKTVLELLSQKQVFLPSKELIAGYEKSMELYRKYQDATGEQFIADGEADVIEGRWSSGRSAMVQDGVPDKLVMDDKDDEGQEYGDDKPLIGNSLFSLEKEGDDTNVLQAVIPIHPFLKLFDLDRHEFVILHVSQLHEYKWNPALGDKLILPPDHKEVIQILMDTASEDIDDIIKGKSGGTIVICTGEPGTGKTLTAEVTSEVVKRPLYKVNCSQLGTNEEAIEKTLTNVLSRATRWKALLLIDEADVYVRERDKDIQQNAIVGVFLRVLEYYRGILFLTSNRATVIDDAIMSRSTVHLKYLKPEIKALAKIWRSLSDQFGLKFTDGFITELTTTFPEIVGRDVKNLLKLAIRYTRRMGGKITVDTFKKLAPHKDIKHAGKTD